MRAWMVVIGVLGFFICSAQGSGFRVDGMASVTIPVTVDKMTNLIFPEAVLTGMKVSQEVRVLKVRGVENVIQLKALRRGFVSTNLSIYGRDGRLYSFVLHYVADTEVLNFRVVAGPGAAGAMILAGLGADVPRLREEALRLAQRRFFLHVRGSASRLRLRLGGVYLADSLQWMVFSLSDASPMGMPVAELRFFVQDKRRIRRQAMQEVPVGAVYNGAPSVVSGSVRFAVGFEPFSIVRGKRLVVEVIGKDGRRVELRVKGKVLMRGRK